MFYSQFCPSAMNRLEKNSAITANQPKIIRASPPSGPAQYIVKEMGTASCPPTLS